MKRALILAAALAVSAPAWSHGGAGMMGEGYGMGPGMMGPGMMGGYGMGPGMMGPGMMGPGMMGGYGMGPGMMGPGMMGGYGGGWGYGVNLTDEQRSKMADIRQELARQRWELMEKLHSEGGPMHQAFMAGTIDEQAARKAYDAMAQAHKQMFESWLQARKRMEAVLTPEQREQLSGRSPRNR